MTTEELPTRRQLKDLEAGAEVDGELVQPVSVQPETSDPAHKNRLRIVVAEGRNREVWVASRGIGPACCMQKLASQQAWPGPSQSSSSTVLPVASRLPLCARNRVGDL